MNNKYIIKKAGEEQERKIVLTIKDEKISLDTQSCSYTDLLDAIDLLTDAVCKVAIKKGVCKAAVRRDVSRVSVLLINDYYNGEENG